MGGLNASEKAFWSEFLNLYRSLPYLWWDNADILEVSNRENYRNKTIKAKQKLLEYVKTRFPDADSSFVQRKIHNFRCGFHREYRKKHKLEANGEVHRPILWYYKQLLFLVDEENPMDLIDDNNSHNLKTVENTISEKQDEINAEEDNETFELIDIKEEDESDYNETQTEEDIQNENSFLHQSTEHDDFDNDPTFKFNINGTKPNQDPEFITLEDLKKLREQATSSNSIDQLKRIPDSTISVDGNMQSLKRKNNQTEEQHHVPVPVPIPIETVKPKKIKLNDIYNLVDRAITQTEQQPKEDMFDVIGRKLAYDLREMHRGQRIFAEKIINDVIYYGKADRLRSTFYFSPSV